MIPCLKPSTWLGWGVLIPDQLRQWPPNDRSWYSVAHGCAVWSHFLCLVSFPTKIELNSTFFQPKPSRKKLGHFYRKLVTRGPRNSVLLTFFQDTEEKNDEPQQHGRPCHCSQGSTDAYRTMPRFEKGEKHPRNGEEIGNIHGGVDIFNIWYIYSCISLLYLFICCKYMCIYMIKTKKCWLANVGTLVDNISHVAQQQGSQRTHKAHQSHDAKGTSDLRNSKDSWSSMVVSSQTGVKICENQKCLKPTSCLIFNPIKKVAQNHYFSDWDSEFGATLDTQIGPRCWAAACWWEPWKIVKKKNR